MAVYKATSDYKLFMGNEAGTPESPPDETDTFAEVTQLSSIERGDIGISQAAYYRLDAPGAFRIGGQANPTDWNGKAYHDRAITQHVNIESDARVTGGRVRNWRIRYSNGQEYTIQGFISSFKEDPAQASGDAAPPKQFSFVICETKLISIAPFTP